MYFVSWDDEIPNIWKNKNHVPNHQSGLDLSNFRQFQRMPTAVQRNARAPTSAGPGRLGSCASSVWPAGTSRPSWDAWRRPCWGCWQCNWSLSIQHIKKKQMNVDSKKHLKHIVTSPFSQNKRCQFSKQGCDWTKNTPGPCSTIAFFLVSSGWFFCEVTSGHPWNWIWGEKMYHTLMITDLY